MALFIWPVIVFICLIRNILASYSLIVQDLLHYSTKAYCQEAAGSLQSYHQRPSRGPPEASHPVKASHLSYTRWHRGGLHGGLLEGFWRMAFSKLTHLSCDSLLCLSASLVLASNSQSGASTLPPPQAQIGFQPGATGWLVKADVCAKPPCCKQRPSGGPLDVNMGHFGLHDDLLSLLEGRLCSLKKSRWVTNKIRGSNRLHSNSNHSLCQISSCYVGRIG